MLVIFPIYKLDQDIQIKTTKHFTTINFDLRLQKGAKMKGINVSPHVEVPGEPT